MSAKPENLDGQWTPDPEPDHHGYQYYRAGPVAVRYHPGFEPAGELVTAELVGVHIERMDSGYWWMALRTDDGREVHVEFHSRTTIAVRWRNEG